MSDFWRGLLIGLAGSLVVLCGIFVGASRRWRRRAWRIKRSLARIRGAHRRRISRLNARVSRAEQLAEVGTLTGGLAHEIKNPLSTVLLNLQLLQEELDPADPAQSRIVNRLATVSREATRLRDILDDFLKYAGKIELRRQSVDLNSLLEELVDFFAPQAQLNRVQVRFKPQPGEVRVSIDPRLIKQTVLNLMLNALQAMGGGGELILSASLSNSSAVIDVIDTGPGIPADEQEKIFQAYYSTKKGGTGLGLAMARRIVEEHGGQIGVRSEVGKGSDFFIRLPLG
jgi:two-component system sensor histidine kinase HydH